MALMCGVLQRANVPPSLLHMHSLTCGGDHPQLLWLCAPQKAIRLSAEQERQMVGARRQLLAGLQRSRAQRQRLIAQLRPADGEMPTEALASDTMELVSPNVLRHLHASSKRQLATPTV